MILSLDHFALGVVDFEAERVFFMETLGFELKRLGTRHGTGAQIAFLADQASNFKIELVEASDKETGILHLAFRVDNVQVEYQNLLANGLLSIQEPHELPAAKAKTALLEAASGLKIQIIEYAPDSPDL
ncbi:MAG: VOC family protein [Chloroflexi bacterium]|nr:VOC family protein [Chloroflexota bacterium]